MGKINDIFNRCIGSRERYADCFNAAVGSRLLSPQRLCDMDSVLSGKRLGERGTYEKRRDCLKGYLGQNGKQEAVCAVIGVENQSRIDGAMAVRSLIYDAYTYDRQLSSIREGHRKKGDLSRTWYVSGFAGTDRILPVITVCVYFGEEPWDVPVNLHGLMNFEVFPQEHREAVKRLVNDYHLIVLDVRHMEEDILNGMDSDLRHLFGILRCDKDKEQMRAYVEKHRKALEDVEEELYDAIAVMTGTRALQAADLKVKNDKGGYNMCKAFEDMMKDERMEGRKEGESIGIRAMVKILRELKCTNEYIAGKLVEHFSLSEKEASEYTG